MANKFLDYDGLAYVFTKIKAMVNAKAPTSHASSDTTYGVSSDTNYGHAKASGTTPKAHGTAAVGSETAAFARGDHVHPAQVATHGVTTSGTGAAYTATVEGITELTAGATFIMIPHVASTTNKPTLNVNGLGAKNLRQPLTTNTAATTTAELNTWLTAGKPVQVMYDGTLWKIGIPRPSATSLYGSVPIESGGTGAITAEDALTNLGAAPAASLKAAVVTLTADGWTGDAAPYSQTLTVDGMTADWVPGVPVIVATDTQETNVAMQEALACVSQITSADNALTFICYEAQPTADMDIRVPGVIV